MGNRPNNAINCGKSIIVESQPVRAVLQPRFLQPDPLPWSTVTQDMVVLQAFQQLALSKQGKQIWTSVRTVSWGIFWGASHKVYHYWTLIYGRWIGFHQHAEVDHERYDTISIGVASLSRLLLHRNHLRHPYQTVFALLRRPQRAVICWPVTWLPAIQRMIVKQDDNFFESVHVGG